jgi:rare lipoprotein A
LRAVVLGGLLLLLGPFAGAADDLAVPAGPAVVKLAYPLPSKAVFGTAAVLDADLPGLHGLASFYGFGFVGRCTASGERFDPRRFTAASNRFSLGSLVAALRPDTGRCAVVRINDRMHAKHRRRIIDVTRGVAEHLGMVRAGVVVVRLIGLPADWAGTDEADCRAAFAIEPDCADCLAEAPDTDSMAVVEDR